MGEETWTGEMERLRTLFHEHAANREAERAAMDRVFEAAAAQPRDDEEIRRVVRAWEEVTWRTNASGRNLVQANAALVEQGSDFSRVWRTLREERRA